MSDHLLERARALAAIRSVALAPPAARLLARELARLGDPAEADLEEALDDLFRVIAALAAGEPVDEATVAAVLADPPTTWARLPRHAARMNPPEPPTELSAPTRRKQLGPPSPAREVGRVLGSAYDGLARVKDYMLERALGTEKRRMAEVGAEDGGGSGSAHGDVAAGRDGNDDGGAEAGAEPPAAAPEPSRKTPRTMFALLDAPGTVLADDPFDIEVGVAPHQTPGVGGGPLEVPPDTPERYTIVVQLVAAGFELVDGGTWRRELSVTPEDPYPSIQVRLRAGAQDAPVVSRAIETLYSVGDQTIGMAYRPVAVVRSADLLASTEPEEEPGATDIGVPSLATAPDLTIRINVDPSRDGGLLWTVESPHPAIEPTDTPLESSVGNDPREFAKQLVGGVSARRGRPNMHTFLRGAGRQVADAMPAAVLDAIHVACATTQPDPPTVLLLSEEPYVPWELAYLDDRPGDPNAPPYLGAQAVVGRWVLRGSVRLPPPDGVDAAALAVVWGVYPRKRLEEAEAEAEFLETEYRARPVPAKLAEVTRCLEGSPAVDVLHFAVHGLYAPESTHEGIQMVDGNYVGAMDIEGGRLERAPFVFLNACQIGSGNRVLGDYGGIASSFLRAGAASVIAPLWSVDDGVARTVAVDFYGEAFAGAPAADVIRRTRARFTEDDSAEETYLAYQFFGHPALLLSRR